MIAYNWFDKEFLDVGALFLYVVWKTAPRQAIGIRASFPRLSPSSLDSGMETVLVLNLRLSVSECSANPVGSSGATTRPWLLGAWRSC